ncbi:MAG TPA: alpha/beta fold hydrolase [Actinomycetes bacterium]|nr:alpha/beta fold hydrolase [Actinomycetes bacterium]
MDGPAGDRGAGRALTVRGLAAALLVVPLAVGGCAGTGPGDGPASGRTPGAELSQPALHSTRAAGHRMSYRCMGDPSDPSVLLLAGFNTELEHAWHAVQPSISRFARVCAYDRLGVGNSDPPPARQTFADLADQLDAVVTALHLHRPLVLVAHSLGGTVAMTWAEHHRDDLAGLVLIDATPPAYLQTVMRQFPRSGTTAGAELRSGLATLLVPHANAEHLAGRQGLLTGTYGDLGSAPVTALTHTISEWGDVSRKQGALLDSSWLTGQQAWADLSSNGAVVSVPDAGHEIQVDQPAAVVDTVRQVVSGRG